MNSTAAQSSAVSLAERHEAVVPLHVHAALLETASMHTNKQLVWRTGH